MILGCEDCGENLPYVEVDGYIVGDTLLEGVIFHFFPNRSVKVSPEGEKYFETLNKKLWLKRIQEHVMDGADDTICPKCKKEAYVGGVRMKGLEKFMVEVFPWKTITVCLIVIAVCEIMQTVMMFPS